MSAEKAGSSRDHAHTSGIALEGIPRSPPESFDLEPGESYAKWAVALGPMTLEELLDMADECAGYDDPGLDAGLGARLIVSRHALRAAISSAKQDPGDSSRDANPSPPDSGLLPTEREREGGWDPRTDPLAYMIYRTLDVMGVVRLTAKQAMWVASEVRRYGLPLPPADHGADVRPSDSEEEASGWGKPEAEQDDGVISVCAYHTDKRRMITFTLHPDHVHVLETTRDGDVFSHKHERLYAEPQPPAESGASGSTEPQAKECLATPDAPTLKDPT